MRYSSSCLSFLSLVGAVVLTSCTDPAALLTETSDPTEAGLVIPEDPADPAGEESNADGPSLTLSLVCTDESFLAGLVTGAGRDAIPALQYPISVPAVDAPLEADDRVLGIVVDGEARAYPLLLLWNHEIANDTLAGRALLVSYCPLTGSGLVFDRRIDGQSRMFGVSGMLFENNLVMYDHQTETLWTQMMLGSQCGPDRGKGLDGVPVMETTWGDWKAMYPETRVSTNGTRSRAAFGPYPYDDYDELYNATTLYPSSPYSTERPPKELVLGVSSGSQAVAYPFGILENRGRRVALNDRVGSQDLVVVYSAESNAARAFDRRLGRRVLTFSVLESDDGFMTDRETGSTWDRAGRAISGPLSGEHLVQIRDSYSVFWFAWSVYFPHTRVSEGLEAESRM